MQGIKIATQLCELVRQSLGDGSYEHAKSLDLLAGLLLAKGDATSADPLLLKAKGIYGMTLPEEHPDLLLGPQSLSLQDPDRTFYVEPYRPAWALVLAERVAAMEQRFRFEGLRKLAYQLEKTTEEFMGSTFYRETLYYFDVYMSLALYFLRSLKGALLAFELALTRKAIYAEWELLTSGIKGPADMFYHKFSLRQGPALRDAVAQALPDDSALIEYARFDVIDFSSKTAFDPDFTYVKSRWRPPQYLAFVFLARKPNVVRAFKLGNAKQIEEMVAMFRSSISGEAEGRNVVSEEPRPRENDRVSNGDALRVAILDPLISALRGRKRVFIAPDGELSRLPFETLPNWDGRRLIEDYQISYLSVGRDLLRFDKKSTGRPEKALVVADPDFDLTSGAVAQKTPKSLAMQSRDLDRQNLHFKRLPETRIEGEVIAKVLNAQALLEAQALEARLKAHRSPKILHIATHGFFLPDQKFQKKTRNNTRHYSEREFERPLLRSGLALAGANTSLAGGPLPAEAEDAILNAEDVSGMNLSETELVVLSACETGLGDVHVGEGVFGLRRAFMLAGARTLVMSLWKVPDEQTQELMVDFYKRLLDGQSRAEALRRAQLKVKKKYPDPKCWGAFICQGDPGPLPERLHSSQRGYSRRKSI